MNALRIEITPRTIAFAVLGVAVAWLFIQLWSVLVVVLCALMIAGALTPSITRLERHKIRRPYAIAIVFVGLLVAGCAFAAATLPTLFDQVVQVLTHLPETKNELAKQLDSLRIGAPFARSLRQTHITEIVSQAQHVALAYSSQVVIGLAYVFSTLFLALYLIIDRDRIRGSVFALIPRAYHIRVSRILLELELIVGGYVRAQVITSVLMMLFTFVVLMFARVPNALALALFAGVADVLPYVGAFLACIPAALAALPLGVTTALVVLGVLAAYQEFESRYIVPRVYGGVLRLPSAIVMIALLVGAKLLGILGALLALPIAAGMRTVFLELRISFPGDDYDDTRGRERAAALERDFEERAAGTRAAEAAAIATELAMRAGEDPGSVAPRRSPQ